MSRCQRFDLRRIPTQIIADQLKFIAERESITISEGAAYAIAKGADGGMRDAQSMLDQMVAFCGNTIEEQDVLDIFGFNSEESVVELADSILTGDNSRALELVYQSRRIRKRSRPSSSGTSSGTFRNVLVKIVDPNAGNEELAPETRKANHANTPAKLPRTGFSP